jgi:uncharacterized protein (TIGR03435 family)
MTAGLLFGAALTIAAQAQPGAFEAASVRPSPSNDSRRAELRFLPGGGVSIIGIPLYMIVATAHAVPYQSHTDRLTGGPDWVRSQRFDIQAKAAPGAMDGLTGAARLARTRAMLRSLLEERFHLKVRRESRELPVYVLSVAPGGLKLKPAKVDDKSCPDDGSCHQITGGQGRGVHGKAVDLPDIARYIENWTDRPVVNAARADGLFDIDTDPWVSMFPVGVPPGPPSPAPGTESPSDPVRPSLFNILARVGLKLEAGKAKVDAFVIEHIQQPTPN